MTQSPWLSRHLTAEQRAAAFFHEVGMIMPNDCTDDWQNVHETA